MALKAIALLFLREVSEILILKKGGMSISSISVLFVCI